MLNPENRNDPYGSLRVSHVLRIGGGRDICVVVWIQYLTGIGVGHADGILPRVAQVILEGILFRGVKPREGNPPAAGSIVAEHLRLLVVAQRPVVEVAHHMGEILPCAILVLVIEHQCHGAVVNDVDAMLQPGGHGATLHRSRLKWLVLAVGDVFNKEIIAILVAFLFAIGTSDHNTDLVDRCLAGAKPFADGGGELELPCICLALYLLHPAFRNVLFPFCRHILPGALTHHTNMGIDLTGVVE